MTGATIAIDDAAAADTILSVKERVFAANRELPVRRQRLVYRPGPRGMEALADDETLGGAGVARDGTAKLDVLQADLSSAEVYASDTKKKTRLYCLKIGPHYVTARPRPDCLGHTHKSHAALRRKDAQKHNQALLGGT